MVVQLYYFMGRAVCVVFGPKVLTSKLLLWKEVDPYIMLANQIIVCFCVPSGGRIIVIFEFWVLISERIVDIAVKGVRNSDILFWNNLNFIACVF